MSKTSEFDKFLNDLSDHELAIFIGYRYYGFLKESRNKIIKEVKKRNLSNEQIKYLFNKKLNEDLKDKSEICSKCGSDRLFVETDYEERARGSYATAEIAIDTKRCRLCGYNPSKSTPKNLLERIKRIFKNDKSERVINWKTW
jgi:DNA-binding transcriptional MerR regulator